MASQFGTITLMGSGELTDSMAKVHRSLLGRAGASANAVFLDTPAGFELNSDEITARAVEYFQQRFGVMLQVASFKSRNRATARQVEEALNLLRRANFIFAGPGSPSYAIRNWRGSTVWDTLVARLTAGAQLVFASAAAIGIGCHALPVYEIYKAGDEVDWIDGLDLLGLFRLKLAIIPHWNNAEGGSFDTRYCYMGEPRLKILQALLPFDVVVLGIDEHTACTFDPAAQTITVAGAGQVTVRYGGRETPYPAGSVFSFAKLRAANLDQSAAAAEPDSAPPAPSPSPELLSTTRYLEQIARAMEESGGEPGANRTLIDHAHETMHELAQGWRASDNLLPAENADALVELLVSTRARLRAAKQFALADEVRQALTDLGILLEDTPDGTHWYKSVEKK
jgi:cyanophycinase-like exopeptidase